MWSAHKVLQILAHLAGAALWLISNKYNRALISSIFPSEVFIVSLRGKNFRQSFQCLQFVAIFVGGLFSGNVKESLKVEVMSEHEKNFGEYFCSDYRKRS